MKRLLCTFFGLLLPAAAIGDVRYVSITNESIIDPISFVEFYEDPTRSLQIEDVRDLSFSPLESDQINFGFTASKFWLRFGVVNQTDQRIRRVLKTTARFMRPLEIYHRKSAGYERVLYNDETSDFEPRPGGSRHLGYAFELDPGESTELYICFGAGGSASLGMVIATEADVVAEQSDTSLKVAVFVAVIGTLILSNLIYFAAIRALAFLTYVVQETIFLLYVTHMDGFTFQYLWPTLPFINANASPVLGGLCLVTALWFSMTFLQSKRYTPNYYRFLLGLLFVLIANAVLAVFLSSRVFNQVGLTLFFVLAANLIPHSIYVVLKGHLAARFYLAGWIFLIVTVGWFSGALLFGYPMPFTPTDVVKVGMSGEAIILAMGLADQYRRINDEKNTMQADLVSQLNARLDEAKERAELEREKEQALKEVIRNSRVLATTSHDIAQPLGALKAAIREMEQAAGPDVLESLKSTIDDMEVLVGGALDDASGAMQEVSREVQTDVGQLVHEVSSRYQTDALEKGIFIREHSVNLNAVVSANTLRRCLGNLISNAVRYTSEGGVLVAARKRGSDLLIQVFDTGCGIADDDIALMMQEHEKSELSPGHGLGLSIVKSICQQTGWCLDIRSRPGQGSCFSISISGVLSS